MCPEAKGLVRAGVTSARRDDLDVRRVLTATAPSLRDAVPPQEGPVPTLRMVTALTRAPCGLASRIPTAERAVVGGSAPPGARGGTVRGPSDPGEDHRAG
jgi:hypothetical protein